MRACVRPAALAQLLGRKLKGERLRQAMYEDLRGERTAPTRSSWNELSFLGQTLTGEVPWRPPSL